MSRRPIPRRRYASKLNSSAAYACEPLERRMMLTTLTVNGTSGDDVFTYTHIGDTYSVTVNGSPTFYPAASFDEMVLNGLAGADVFNIEKDEGHYVTANGGDGDDSCNLSPTAQNLDDVGGRVTFDAGPGSLQRLDMYDSLSTSHREFHHTPHFTGYTRFGGIVDVPSPSVDYITVRAGPADNEFYVYGSAADEELFFFGDAGDDKLYPGISDYDSD
ncbi:MAG: hypothetical protein ACREJC_06820, partial [Tepidisphaeraceae bacterium]